jgi:hypothetical protein
MLKCEVCKRVTPKRESTGLLITYSNKLFEDEHGKKVIAKQIASQKRTGWNCSGERMEK